MILILLENLKTEYDKSKEKELLQEMLEVVEKREQLISDVEDTKRRYCKENILNNKL